MRYGSIHTLLAVVMYVTVACGGGGADGRFAPPDAAGEPQPPPSPATASLRQVYVAENGNDSGAGTATDPWRSLQRAIRAATPGTTVWVAPGTYWGAVESTISGTPGARIQFVSTVRGSARIIADSYTAWRNSGNYVDIAGFDITGSGSLGILNLGSHVRIIANRVHNIPAAGCTSDGGAGIDNGNYSGQDNEITANIVHDIGNPAVPCPRVHGIYHADRNGRIWNNIAYRNQAFGIHLWHAADAVTIANNLVFQNGEGGIVFGAGDKPGGVTADNMVVTNNIILENGVWGPGWALRESGNTGGRGIFRNNLIFRQAKDISLKNSKRDSGTIRKDPKFRNYKADGSGDYRPASDSPAIRAGTTDGIPPRDIDGRPRVRPPDIGPYQSNAPMGSWPWF